MTEDYKGRYTFAMDFGTSDFKFGPISCGETPAIIQNRGYFPDTNSIISKTFENSPEVVVGESVALHLQSTADLSRNLVYPMRNGVIARDDARSWRVVKDLIKLGLNSFLAKDPQFDGFYLVCSIAALCPKYMYEKIFDVCREISSDTHLIKAVTIVPQPLAVAIAHKSTTCVVEESGHGNTQVCPVSRYPIRNSVVAINRGGGDANSITREILKDLGYGDLVHEESFIRKVKENIGLLPENLDEATAAAKRRPNKFKAKFKIPGTRVMIDLGNNSWMRFLIGEYIFNPNHVVFESYFTRGMPKPKDALIGDAVYSGMLDMGQAVVDSVERCPIELQPHLYRQILLSGGNFCWNHDEKLDGIATDSSSKMKRLLREKGVTNVKITKAERPQYSVWQGSIIYGYAVPSDYEWTWDRMEGWVHYRAG